MKPSELIAEPSAWCRGYFAKDKQKMPIDVENPHACSWCVLGAIHRTGAWREEGKLNELFMLLNKRGWTSPAAFNDDPKVTHEMVISVLKEVGL